jgi:hypothetical protein
LVTDAPADGLSVTRVAMPAGIVASTVLAMPAPAPVRPPAVVGTGDAIVLHDDDAARLVVVRDDGGTTSLDADVLDDVVQAVGTADVDGFWGVSVPAVSLDGFVVAVRPVDAFGTPGEPTTFTIDRSGLFPTPGGGLVFGDAGGTYRFDGSAVTRLSDGAPVAAGPAHLLVRQCTRQHTCRFEVMASDGGQVQRTFELAVDLLDAWLSPDGASLVGIEDSASPSGAAPEVRPPRLVHVDLTTGQVTPIAALDDFPLPSGGIGAGVVAWATDDVVVFRDGRGDVAGFDRRTGQVGPVLAEPRDDVVAVTTRPLRTASERPAGGEVSAAPG